MVLSEYELERAANIAANRRRMSELGLLEEEDDDEKPVVEKEKRTYKKRDRDAEPTRRCARLAHQKVEYTGLDRSYNEDEIGEDGNTITRRGRKTSKTKFFSASFAFAEKQKSAARSIANRVSTAIPASEHSELDVNLNGIDVQELMGFMDFPGPGLTGPKASNIPSYEVSGRRSVCNYCQGVFVLKKDGRMRSHKTHDDHVCPGSLV